MMILVSGLGCALAAFLLIATVWLVRTTTRWMLRFAVICVSLAAIAVVGMAIATLSYVH